MDGTEFRPSKGYHAAAAIQLHGAASEGDHAMYKAEILRRKVGYVPQHLCFRMVFVEHWMRQEVRSASHIDRDGRHRWFGKIGERKCLSGCSSREDTKKFDEIICRHTLIESHPHMLVVDPTKIDESLRCMTVNCFS